MYERPPNIVLKRLVGFDWDEGNLEKCQKHGVPVGEIEMVLMSDPAVAPDLKHSAKEDRFIAVGRNWGGRPLFVAFTVRERDGHRFVRPVSARYMHEKEVKRYETAST